MREYKWNATTTNFFGLVTDQEAVRANVLFKARCYWPMDLLEPFVREAWPRWRAERPEWFTEEREALLRARIPPAWIGEDV